MDGYHSMPPTVPGYYYYPSLPPSLPPLPPLSYVPFPCCSTIGVTDRSRDDGFARQSVTGRRRSYVTVLVLRGRRTMTPPPPLGNHRRHRQYHPPQYYYYHHYYYYSLVVVEYSVVQQSLSPFPSSHCRGAVLVFIPIGCHQK